jgi:transcriptional antiterminator RfaH
MERLHLTATPTQKNAKAHALFLGHSWYVAHTKPRAEGVAVEHLERQGYRVYLPKVKRLNHKSETVMEPMFPRYLFFTPSTSGQPIAPVQSTVGVSNIVRFGNQPATILESTLQDIEHVERLQHQADFATLTPFQIGTHVEITGGPLQGLEALVSDVAEERVVVMLKLLGRELKTVVKPAHLHLAHA